MLTIIHWMVGLALGKQLNNLWLVIPIALASHYILDLIPHWNPRSVDGFHKRGVRGCNKKDMILKGIEPIFGLFFVIYLIFLSKQFALPMALGAFFAWFPDLMHFLNHGYKIPFPPIMNYLEKKIHNNHKHTTIINGIAIQLIVFAIALFFILK